MQRARPRARCRRPAPRRSTSGSQVSAARSCTGIRGTRSSAVSMSGRIQAAKRSRRACRAGMSRRERNCSTRSPSLRRCMRITTARSMTVSGRAPMPASAAMAKVGNFRVLCSGPEIRRAGRLRWWPALSRPRSSSFFSAALMLPKMGAYNRSVFNMGAWKRALVAGGVIPPRARGRGISRRPLGTACTPSGTHTPPCSWTRGEHQGALRVPRPPDPGFTLRTYTHLLPSSETRTRKAIDDALAEESEAEGIGGPPAIQGTSSSDAPLSPRRASAA